MRVSIVLLLVLAFGTMMITSHAAHGEEPKQEVKEKEKKKEGPREVTAEEIWRGIDRNTEFVLIDIRPGDGYDAEHIRGAVSLPLSEINDETLAKLVRNKFESVFFYGDDEKKMDVFLAATEAAHLGYKKIYMYSMGLSDWKNRGFATTLSN